MMETDIEQIAPRATTADLRIALLAKEQETPFTPEQRAKLSGKLRDLDEAIRPLRAFPLMDGGSEPGILFCPAPQVRSLVPETAAVMEAHHA